MKSEDLPAVKPKTTCPSCGSTTKTIILQTTKTDAKTKKLKVIYFYTCKACNHEWSKEKILNGVGR